MSEASCSRKAAVVQFLTRPSIQGVTIRNLGVHDESYKLQELYGTPEKVITEIR